LAASVFPNEPAQNTSRLIEEHVARGAPEARAAGPMRPWSKTSRKGPTFGLPVTEFVGTADQSNTRYHGRRIWPAFLPRQPFVGCEESDPVTRWKRRMRSPTPARSASRPVMPARRNHVYPEPVSRPGYAGRGSPESSSASGLEANRRAKQSIESVFRNDCVIIVPVLSEPEQRQDIGS